MKGRGQGPKLLWKLYDKTAGEVSGSASVAVEVEDVKRDSSSGGDVVDWD